MSDRTLMNVKPHRHKATQSYSMSRRLHYQNPGQAILRAVRRRLLEWPLPYGELTPDGEAICNAVALVDLCLSRVNSRLEV